MVTSCPKCYADVEPGLKFCTECGTKITRTVSSDVVTSCQCYADVEPGLKFCTECGTKITRTVSSDVVTSCPKCYADVEPGLKFCTECGTSLDIPDTSSSNINEKLRQRRAADGKDVPSEDDTIDNIVESEGINERFRGFLNKTAESFDKKVDNSRQKQVIARKPKATDNNTNPGYLVCNSCGGYYQLEQGNLLMILKMCVIVVENLCIKRSYDLGRLNNGKKRTFIIKPCRI